MSGQAMPGVEHNHRTSRPTVVLSDTQQGARHDALPHHTDHTDRDEPANRPTTRCDHSRVEPTSVSTHEHTATPRHPQAAGP